MVSSSSSFDYYYFLLNLNTARTQRNSFKRSQTPNYVYMHIMGAEFHTSSIVLIWQSTRETIFERYFVGN